MGIGERIKMVRVEKGMTQKQLGDLCGMADSAIRRYESGRGNPTQKTLQRIADALDIHILDLLGAGEHLDKYQATARFPNGDTMTMENVREVYNQVPAETQQEFLKMLREALLDAYDRLNIRGQQKALERIQELTEIPKYQRQPEEGEESAVDPQEND